MQRHNFLTHCWDNARTVRKWSHDRVHCGTDGGRSSSPDWLSSCTNTVDDVLATERQDPLPVEQLTSQPSAKLLYRASMRAQERDRLQQTWGRIQQIGEKEYEMLVEWLKTPLAESRTVLEEFFGFVDQIDGDVAYVTLTTRSGEQLYGEYPASELKASGIHERRRFKCRTIESGAQVEFELEPIPDGEVSEERERAILEKIQKALGDNDGPQDDY